MLLFRLFFFVFGLTSVQLSLLLGVIYKADKQHCRFVLIRYRSNCGRMPPPMSSTAPMGYKSSALTNYYVIAATSQKTLNMFVGVVALCV